jgi:hypothetical protein
VVEAVALLDMPHPESLVAPVVTASVGVVGRVPRHRDDGPALLADALATLELARLQGGHRFALG